MKERYGREKKSLIKNDVSDVIRDCGEVYEDDRIKTDFQGPGKDLTKCIQGMYGESNGEDDGKNNGKKNVKKEKQVVNDNYS